VYPLTIAAWVYPTTLPSVQWVFTTGQNSTVYFGIVALSTGAFRAQCGDGGAASLAEGGTLTTGTWHHVCAVFDTNNLYVYQNGSQVATAANAEFMFSQSDYTVGRMMGGSNYFDGRIAEVGVWSELLTANEIAALAKGVSPAMVQAKELELYLPLWGVASPEIDLSPNQNVGTVTGATLATHCPAGPPVHFAG
jgi:hypothetical protein